MSDKNSAIGVFDSGLGGLTAIKQLRKILPDENFIYFGDTGRVPYGTRSFETIKQYAKDDLRFLSGFDIKAAVVACGTVSAIAIDDLEKDFDLPIVGAIKPACYAAARATSTSKIAVFATPATIGNGAFEKNLSIIDSSLQVFPVACPMFVPLIEAGYIDQNCKVTRLIAAEYIEKLLGTGVDTLILGCTHYPIIASLIRSVASEMLGTEICIIDSGYEAALKTKELLYKANLLADKSNDVKDNCENTRYFVSDETQNFKKIASMFLGEPAENVTKVSIG